MGKTLVITEKKSVADDFAKVLGGFAQKGEHYEGDSMVIAWASGHLLELKQPQDYKKEWRFWSLEALPIIPEKYEHVPRGDDARSQKLLNGLVRLIRRKDVDGVVNACDAGREGELIFNLVAQHAGNEKPVQRLWLQSMTTSAIKAAFTHLEPDSKFRNLRDAAFARDQADWLVGMNGTRALTKRFLGRTGRHPLAVGRVKTPTLAFLVDREREVDRFVPQPYFEIHGVFETGAGTYDAQWSGTADDGTSTDRLFDRERAEAVLRRVQGHEGIATDATKETVENPPPLFDLTSLQRASSAAFGYTLKRTLSIVQRLYEEKKAVTYPRTSSRYLPEDYVKEVPVIVRNLGAGRFGPLVRHLTPDLKPVNHRAVYNDAKVTDHFALIPTGEVPQALRDEERKVYDMIVRRFLSAFAPAAVWERTNRETVVESESFRCGARRLKVPGWRAIETTGEDEPLPVLEAGGAVTAKEIRIDEKKTSPPKRFTDGTLVGEMETAGKHVEDEDLVQALKEKGIGTPATRAAIVEDLIYKGLARRDRRTLVPTPLGSTLVRLVRNLQLDALAKPDLTGEWEYNLKKMVDGKYQKSRFDGEIVDMVNEAVRVVKNAEEGAAVFSRDHPPGLKCPKCGSPIVEKAYSYYCSDEEGCGLRWNKDASGKTVFPETLFRLFRDGQVGPLTGFERPRVPCTLKLLPEFQIEIVPEAGAVPEGEEAPDDQGNVVDVPEGTVMGACPICKSDVQSKGMGYQCTKDGCTFRLGKKILFKFLPPDEVRKMLSGKRTDAIHGFISRRGRRFSAHLLFDAEGKLKWEWPERKTEPKKPKKEKAPKETVPAEGEAAEKPKKPAPKKRTRKKTTKVGSEE